MKIFLSILSSISLLGVIGEKDIKSKILFAILCAIGIIGAVILNLL